MHVQQSIKLKCVYIYCRSVNKHGRLPSMGMPIMINIIHTHNHSLRIKVEFGKVPRVAVTYKAEMANSAQKCCKLSCK